MFKKITVEIRHEGVPGEKIERPLQNDGTISYKGQWRKVEEGGFIEVGPKPVPVESPTYSRRMNLNMTALALQAMFGGFR